MNNINPNLTNLTVTFQEKIEKKREAQREAAEAKRAAAAAEEERIRRDSEFVAQQTAQAQFPQTTFRAVRFWAVFGRCWANLTGAK